MSHTVLDNWLEKHKAREAWMARTRSKGIEVTCYTIGRHTFLVMRLGDGGWDIFTGIAEGSIARTLADAEKRLGLAPEPDPDDIAKTF